VIPFEEFKELVGLPKIKEFERKYPPREMFKERYKEE